MPETNIDQRIYRGEQAPASDAATRLANMPPPPPWRAFAAGGQSSKIATFRADQNLVKMVNAALLLRRPMLLEGEPGSGKTSLAYCVAEELGLPGPFRWSITSRTTLRDGLYMYDALARLHDSQMPDTKKRAEDIGRYLRLGPVGMAFAITTVQRPAVLLIDEIDKCDMDLPSDLLHLFEEGNFSIPELERLETGEAVNVLPCVASGKNAFSSGTQESRQRVAIQSGQISCRGEFPFVIMTSNQSREFPGPFLRRCLRVSAKPLVTESELLAAARDHLKTYAPHINDDNPSVQALIARFAKQGEKNIQSFDQLLNALVLQLKGHARFEADPGEPGKIDNDLLESVWASLGTRQKQ
jgi:MoxR-like ATPase